MYNTHQVKEPIITLLSPIFDQTDYFVYSGSDYRGYIFVRNPHAELIMMLKFNDLITKVDIAEFCRGKGGWLMHHPA